MSLQALARPVPAAAAASQRRTIPFDYQFYVPIFDAEDEQRSFVDQVVSATLTVSIEAPFVATSVGYGFVPRVQTITFGPQVEETFSPAAVSLGDIISSLSENLGEATPNFSLAILKRMFAARVVPQPFAGVIAWLVKTLGNPNADLLNATFRKMLAAKASPQAVGPQTAAALLQGIRINPALTQRFLQVLQDGDAMGPDELAKLFQTFEPPPERIQFLYALYDNGTGRAFQSEPLLNIAGLGISDGDRPFRHFATPILFSPRSTIQLDITPKTEFRGELYVALHGYKVLGGEGTPTGHRLAEGTGRRRLRRR